MSSSDVQFGRQYRLDVGDRRFEGTDSTALKITFEVERDSKRYPNKCAISLYNLARPTIHALQANGNLPVRLEVGYRRPGLSQIFFGELRRVTTRIEKTETITPLFGGDATTPLSTATIARTFPKGTPIGSVLEALVTSLGLGTGNLRPVAAAKFAGRTLSRALTISGGTADELQEFTRSYGLSWSVQAGAFTIQDIGAPVPVTSGVLLNKESGLLDSPTVDPKTKNVSGKAFLQPALLPGAAFEVDSEFVQGRYIAGKTKHSGDWSSNDWHVEFEGKPL